MARKQRGITLMSFILVLVVIGFFALIAMKLFPMYSEYNNVKGVMKLLSESPTAGSMTLAQMNADLERRFNIAYVETVRKEHIKLIRSGRGNQLNIAYEVRKPLLFNLDVVGKFDHTVDLQGSRSSD